MGLSPRMVVLLVDALGWNLASRSPGFGAALPHRRRIETILGFSSGALPTLFTGRPPAEHGRWLMYRRARTGTPFAGFGWLRFAPPRLRRSWKVGRLLRRVVEARGVRGYFDLYDVPREELEAFDLPEREDPFAPGGLPVDSLWDSLERRRVPWARWNWRTAEADNLAALLDRLERGDERFLFCYTAELDARLHAEGSAGAGVRERLDGYARFLERACAAGARRGPVWLYLLSDHGMVDVDRAEDLMARLAPLSARRGRDYLAFFDSTMARFWWRAPGARDAVRRALEGAPGRWLDAATLEREGCRFPGADYGDDVFLLDPGALLLPSFMGRDPVAAMHGYDPAHPDMAALLWSSRPIGEPVRRLADVRGFLESELDRLAEAG